MLILIRVDVQYLGLPQRVDSSIIHNCLLPLQFQLFEWFKVDFVVIRVKVVPVGLDVMVNGLQEVKLAGYGLRLSVKVLNIGGVSDYFIYI